MRFCLNVDHVATIREARGGNEPDPVTAALLAELYGADGIVCHLREDRRHINDRDLRLLRESVQTKLDMEMAIIDEIMGICVETLPDLATLVPERRQEVTTEGGLDVAGNLSRVMKAVTELHAYEIEVSLFVDPEHEQVEAAVEAGADIIEIHTGDYANALTYEDLERERKRVAEIAAYAKSKGLGVNAGHGLNYLNVEGIASIPEIDELSIGHAVISRAVFVGLPEAVREMARLVKK